MSACERRKKRDGSGKDGVSYFYTNHVLGRKLSGGTESMVVSSWCRSPGPGCVSGVSLDLNWLLRLSPLLPEGTERGRGGLLIPCPSPGEIKVKATQTVLVVTVVSGTKTTTGRRGHTLSSMRRKVARAKIVGLSVQVLRVLPASTIRSTIPNQTPGLRGFAIDAQWPRYTKGVKRSSLNVETTCTGLV